MDSRDYYWQGSIACAEGALTAGCRFYAGYPITPASEIMEHMARRLPQEAGVFIQMEDEIGALSAVIGASWAGAKAMTATSGPGFSLMQENVGLAIMHEVPLVLVNVQRAGPSTGQATKCAQGDVMQARWGTHGDHEVIALSPNSVQEMFDLTVKAFNLAEKYRVPVILLSDATIAHMRENIQVPSLESIEIMERLKPSSGDRKFFGGLGDAYVPPMPRVGDGFNILATGSTHDEYGIRRTVSASTHKKLVTRLANKIKRNADKIVDAETCNIEDCDVGVVSFGVTSRSVYEVAKLAEKKGLSIGFVRPRVLWPFPEEDVAALAEAARYIIVPEMNLGQIVYEVERIAKGRCKIVPLNKIGGGELITPNEMLSTMLKMR